MAIMASSMAVLGASVSSPGLAALNGIAEAIVSVPAIFALATSAPAFDPRAALGPLTVDFADVFVAMVAEGLPDLTAALVGREVPGLDVLGGGRGLRVAINPLIERATCDESEGVRTL